MEAFRDCDSDCDVGCWCMESAANRDASGDAAVPAAIGRSIDALQHPATCEMGILGGIVGGFGGLRWGVKRM